MEQGRGGRGGGGQRRPAPVVPQPQRFVFAVEVLVLTCLLLAAPMAEGLGASLKFWVSAAVTLLLSMYCMYLLFYGGGARVYSNAVFALAGLLLGYISGVAYRRHILKLKLNNNSPDDLTCLVLAAVSSVLLLRAATLRRAGR